MKSKSTTTSTKRSLKSSGTTTTSTKRAGTKATRLAPLQTFVSSKMSLKSSPQKWVPVPYMKAVVKFLVNNPFAAVLLEPGMRKTSITLAAFNSLLKAGEAEKAVVLAPRRVCHRVWPKEVEKWQQFAHLRVAVCHGSKKDRAAREDADLYVMTYEGWSWFVKSGHFARIKPDTLIVDELSKYKRFTTERHKALRPYLSHFKTRWGLTGSFTPKSLLDVFGQMYVVAKEQPFGQWFTRFRDELFLSTGYGGYTWVPKAGTKETIQARIEPYAVSLKAEDYIQLPQLVIDDREFELEKDVRNKYLEMEKEFLTFVMEERITAPNAAAAKNKCRQMCSGAMYMNGETHLIHAEKLDILDELLEELQGEPLLCIYEFKFEVDMVLAKYGKDVPVLGGGMTDKQADAFIDAWNRNEYPLALIQPSAGGHGLNMQEGNCRHIYGMTLPWDYELYDQVLRRVWRSGNTNERVFLHRALAADTVEEDVMKSLHKKEVTQDDFVQAFKLRVRARGL